MNIRLHILSSSGTLKPFINDIEKNFDSAINIITTQIPARNVDVVVYDNPEGALEIHGIGGYTPNAYQIFISLNPTFKNLNVSINTELKRTLAHELHHTLRWKKPGYGETLLDALVTEGLADHFDIEVFNGKPQPWSVAFTPEELDKIRIKAEKEFDNKDYDHFAWFYGNEELSIPEWAGYSLGFQIIKDYLKRNPDKKPSQLYAAKTSEFIS